jgi:AhpD family alkylhydroperoxidase
LGRSRKSIKSLMKQDPEKAAEIILDAVKQDEPVPYVYKALARRPDLLLTTVEQGKTISKPKFISPKTAQLVAVSAAAALRCKPCLNLHIEEALRKGSTPDEVFEAIFIAGLISKASTLADSLREFESIAKR